MPRRRKTAYTGGDSTQSIIEFGGPAMRFLGVWLAILSILTSVSALSAQEDRCSALVEEALAAVQDACAETSRNQACYGNVSLEVTARDDAPAFTFEQQGDRVDLIAINALRLSSFDELLGQWGIALMKVQANLPNTLPGQNVTFLLFGDVEVEDAATADDEALRPMQAFRLRTRLGSTACENVPADGLLIQTPEGATTITLRVNDVEVELGSTLYLTAQPEAALTISVLEGEATVTVDEASVTVPAGMQTEIPMTEELSPAGEPAEPTPYELEPLELLPLELLPEAITIAPPGGAAPVADVRIDLTNPASWRDIPPAQLCPALDQELATSGMTRASLSEMLAQLKTMDGANIANIEELEQMLARCS